MSKVRKVVDDTRQNNGTEIDLVDKGIVNLTEVPGLCKYSINVKRRYCVCIHGSLVCITTVLQLLSVLDYWTEKLEKGGQVDVIYTDFEKAFDKVPHKRLLSKLHSYGINKKLS